MSSPAAAPAGSPPDSASPPPSSSAPPPTVSSSPPASPLPSTETPPVSSPSPPAPPPESPTPPSPPPPAQDLSPPPPIESPPPPAVQESSPPPPTTESSPPPPASSSPPEQSPPPPARSLSPTAASPPPPAALPPAPSQTTPSATPPASSIASPPPPDSNSTLSPPPPPGTSTTTPTTPSTSTPSTPTTPSPSPSSSGSIPTGTLAIVVIAGVVAVSVLLVLVLCFCKKKKKRHYYAGDHHGPPGGLPAHYKDSYYDPNIKQQGWHSPYSSQSTETLLNMPPPPPPPPPPYMMSDHDLSSSETNSGAAPGMGGSKPWFTYEELATATNGFSKANVLGEGGFGCVFKGVLSNGQVVAVKQLKSGASQGEKEFQAEVEIISRVHHRHLVSLVGYCIADKQRLLVYDYVSNNTLEYHLHKRKGGSLLDWPTRLKIASGAARGLAYLHEDCHPRIIHRDIKSANILLDNNFDAQVSDFGLAKLTSDANTHVTTRVMGTFGYLAPEYASSGKLTEKSDVFSFGVVLLELLTGRKPVDVSQPPGQESLVEWARPILAQVESEDDLEMLADPSLNGAYDSKELMRMAEAAAACVRHSSHKRPRMGQVVRALEGETSLADLNKGLKPGHSSVYGSSFSSSEYEPGSYSADIRKFRMALNETSETGLTPNPYSSSEYQTSREIDQDTRRPMRMSANASSNEFSSSK
ncbi:hypothetical protein L7F22_069453 [Adiantum nelumboides]|nr:hypothetical protein [Adiantum nelumboides]